MFIIIISYNISIAIKDVVEQNNGGRQFTPRVLTSSPEVRSKISLDCEQKTLTIFIKKLLGGSSFETLFYISEF